VPARSKNAGGEVIGLGEGKTAGKLRKKANGKTNADDKRSEVPKRNDTKPGGSLKANWNLRKESDCIRGTEDPTDHREVVVSYWVEKNQNWGKRVQTLRTWRRHDQAENHQHKEQP